MYPRQACESEPLHAAGRALDALSRQSRLTKCVPKCIRKGRALENRRVNCVFTQTQWLHLATPKSYIYRRVYWRDSTREWLLDIIYDASSREKVQ